MASLYKKVISGKPYWYLREMGWVDGKPKMVSERYVGTAADIEALLDAREQAMMPKGFGLHPLLAYCDNTAGPLTAILRPGSVGSNTAADHLAVLTPRSPRCRPDSGGG